MRKETGPLVKEESEATTIHGETALLLFLFFLLRVFVRLFYIYFFALVDLWKSLGSSL